MAIRLNEALRASVGSTEASVGGFRSSCCKPGFASLSKPLHRRSSSLPPCCLSETVRDQALAASGLLVEQLGVMRSAKMSRRTDLTENRADERT